MQIGIVGCGVIGAYLGSKLSKNHNVTILEQRNKIGKESCSGLISERLWDFIPSNKKIVQCSIETADLCFPKRTIKLCFTPKMLVVDRPKLDRFVANLALENGAQILKNHKVLKIFYHRKSRPQLSYMHKGRRYLSQYDFIIGCDGPMSLVRQEMGLGNIRNRLGILCHKRGRVDRLTIWPLKNGFKWCIPRRDDTEYGVLERPEIAKKEFKKLCKKFNIKTKKIYSGLVPQGLVSESKDSLALCGDAAGLTKPWSGGGVIWGLTAADMLLGTFPDSKKYSRELEKFFAPKIFFSKLTTRLIISLGFSLPQLIPKESPFDGDWLV